MPAMTILVPVDFSGFCTEALRYATSLARNMNGRLLIVHVLPVGLSQGEGMLHAGVPGHDRAAAENQLNAVVPHDSHVPVERELLTGDPAAEIVRLAKDRNVDLIVMGTHGRTGLMRLLMGSTAEQVLRHAPCPVLTVRMPQQEHVDKR